MVPPASSLTSATVLSLASTVSVAPNSMALSSRNLLESIAMTREAPHRPVVKMADRPTAPAPTTATVSPGRTFPGEHTDLMAGGQRVGQEDNLLVRDVGGNGVQRGVGVRDPDRLGLGAVDQVAEYPAGPQRSSARSRLTAALIKARWVNACGKLPSASPDAPTSSA